LLVQGDILTKRLLASISVFALIAVAGCSSQPAAKVDPAAQTQTASQPAAPAATPAQAQAPAEGQNAGVQSVTGVVVETMNASNYTYVRVKAEAGELWAATAQFTVAVGDRVVVPLETPMSNFRSESLKRDFPLIYFATRIAREGDAVQPAMMSAHGSAAATAPAGAPQAAAAQPVTNVAPAEGGMTVADVWARRKTLGDKTVTIRAKVVKFNGGILGVNWLHLQDGTGTAKDGTNDITVTSNAAAKVGDVVTVTGKIALDKDLGSGYSYPVILEGATIILK
jgi:hypothetical protein